MRLKQNILIIGSLGQVGTELVRALSERYPKRQVISSDIRNSPGTQEHGEHIILDATDSDAVAHACKNYDIGQVYTMAAMLSAKAEQKPLAAWDLNMKSLLICLELARKGEIKKLFWPSSIAVFGPTSQKRNTPQMDLHEPSTVYGISKLAGERWCAYYHNKYGVDVRSVRYPGLIGSHSNPGGGTTDYAVHIFYALLEHQHYDCFLSADRRLPMMHMDDAIRATIELMETPRDRLTVNGSYNISGTNFTPEELFQEIHKYLADSSISYSPDFRDELAASWPESIEDDMSKRDWNWKAEFDLQRLVKSMLQDIRTTMKA